MFHLAEIEDRLFDDWRMAYLAPDVADMARWTGLEGATAVGDVLETLHREPGRVPRVLVHIVEAIAAEAGGGRGPRP